MARRNLAPRLAASLLLWPIHGIAGGETHSASRPEVQTLSAKQWTQSIAYQKAQLSVRQADLCFVGDSLTEFWTHHGAHAWQENFRDWKSVNCGIAADCTEHVLYRLNAMDLAKAKPRVLVLMMGTNNLSKEPPDAPEEVVKAWAAALDLIQKASPATQVLMLTIPPNTYEAHSNLRRSIIATNTRLLSLAAERRIPAVDAYPLFTDSTDAWVAGLTLDGTHFSPDGYEVLAHAIRPKLIEMLGSSPKQAVR